MLKNFLEELNIEVNDDMLKKFSDFSDILVSENEKMNLSLLDVGGSVLAVSQFTLCADISHGRRPDFFGAAKKDHASPLFDYFCDALRKTGVTVETGEFGADMQVSLVNDGPVTIIMDTDIWKKGN